MAFPLARNLYGWSHGATACYYCMPAAIMRLKKYYALAAAPASASASAS